MKKINIHLLIIGFTLIILSSCTSIMQDNNTVIKEAIEDEILSNANDPESYSFNNFEIVDTVYYNDIVQHKLDKLNSEIEHYNNEIESSDALLDDQRNVLLQQLHELRNELIYYDDVLEMTEHIIKSLQNGDQTWRAQLNQLETKFKETVVTEYRYRNEIEKVQQIRKLGTDAIRSLKEQYQQFVFELENQKKVVNEFVDNGNINMDETAYYVVIFSHRENNQFGGLELFHKIYEVRLIENDVDIIWSVDKEIIDSLEIDTNLTQEWLSFSGNLFSENAKNLILKETGLNF